MAQKLVTIAISAEGYACEGEIDMINEIGYRIVGPAICVGDEFTHEIELPGYGYRYAVAFA